MIKLILIEIKNFVYSLFNGSRKSNIQRFLVLLIILFSNILYTLYTDTVLRKKIVDLKEELSRPFKSVRVENEDLIKQEMVYLAQKCGKNSCVAKIAIKRDGENYFLYFYEVICYDQKNDEYRSYVTSSRSVPMFHSWKYIDNNSKEFTLSLRQKVTKINKEFAFTNALLLYQRLFNSFERTSPMRTMQVAPWYYKDDLDWVLIVTHKDKTFGSSCESNPELLYSTNTKIEKYWKTSTLEKESAQPLFIIEEK